LNRDALRRLVLSQLRLPFRQSRVSRTIKITTIAGFRAGLHHPAPARRPSIRSSTLDL
jgi:hypothetical protein